MTARGATWDLLRTTALASAAEFSVLRKRCLGGGGQDLAPDGRKTVWVYVTFPAIFKQG